VLLLLQFAFKTTAAAAAAVVVTIASGSSTICGGFSGKSGKTKIKI
jgi:hypothetical protein